jgi:peptide deformylase
MKRFYRVLAVVAAVLAVSCSGGKNFSKADLEIIHSNPDELLHIYTVENPAELEVLRSPSMDLSIKALNSEDFKVLSERMLRTVSDTLVGGVGLAAPQIGINKAVIAVCRVDKPGAPFEIYPNIRIITYSEEMEILQEGCLSIPGKREYVDRAFGVEVEYFSLEAQKIVRDTIRDYAARIFQHEIDHLDGKLYTDRVTF